MPKDEQEGQETSLDAGTEGSTVGYMTSGQLDSTDSEEQPEEEDIEAETAEEEEEGEILDEDDEEESEEEEEQPDELEAQRKQLEKHYASKYRELSKKRGMIQMMERISADPENMIPWLAEQYGVELAPKQESKVEFDTPSLDLQPKENESMPGFINRAIAEGMKQIVTQLPKMLETSKGPKVKMPLQKPPMHEEDGKKRVDNALAALDAKYEDWPLYEDEMIAALKDDDSLLDDPDKLYREGKKRSGLFAKRESIKSKKAKRVSTVIRSKGGKRQSANKGKVLSWNDAWSRAKIDASRRTR